MSMIAALIVAILVERFFDCSHLRRFGWYTKYYQMLATKLKHPSPYLLLAVGILPILLIILLVVNLLQPIFYGSALFVVETLLLLYCFGPRNLWADVPTSLDGVFIAANERIFAILFWFGAFGITGAILYRLFALSATMQNDASLASSNAVAKANIAYFDWPVVRLLTFIFALGGNFARVFAFWKSKAMSGIAGNETLLTACGSAALSEQTQSDALHLLDRSLIIFLSVTAVLILL